MIASTRRHFVRTTAALAGGPLFSSLLNAIEPMARGGASRLLLSLAAYSFRNFFPTANGKPNGKAPADGARRMDLMKFVDFCALHGCAGAELTGYYFPADAGPEYFAAVRRHAFLRGVAVSGTAIGNNFSLGPGEQRDQEILKCKQWIDRAAVLGAPHIRVFAGQNRDLPREEADKLVTQALEECCDYAGARGIFLGLENHDAIGSAEHLLKLIGAVRSKWLGVNLDSGNFHTADPYTDFEKCIPYAVNVQVKTDIRREGSKTSEPADLPRILRLLREGGYQGFVALEFEANEDPYEAVPPLLQRLRSLMGA
jgi:sugar phosphate isomerase/epimerase